MLCTLILMREASTMLYTERDTITGTGRISVMQYRTSVQNVIVVKSCTCTCRNKFWRVLQWHTAGFERTSIQHESVDFLFTYAGPDKQLLPSFFVDEKIQLFLVPVCGKQWSSRSALYHQPVSTSCRQSSRFVHVTCRHVIEDHPAERQPPWL